MAPVRRPRKTYSHLADGKRMPSVYALLSSKLSYHDARGLEVDVPVGAFERAHRHASGFVCSDWERFSDPAQTTYTAYVTRRAQQAGFVSGLFESMEAPAYRARISPRLEERMRVFVALRFPLHAFQMTAAYLGALAPASKITIACAFQAADEMCRVQRIAYVMALARLHDPAFGDDARALWQDDHALQPLRRAVEMVLAMRDFAEAYVAHNLCLKPLVDELVCARFKEVCAHEGDPLLAEVLGSLHRDAAWHRELHGAFVHMLLEADPGNADVFARFVDGFAPRALEAVHALAPTLTGGHDARFGTTLEALHFAHLEDLGLRPRARVS